MIRVFQAIRTVDSRQTGGPEEMLLMLSPALRARGRFDSAILLLRKPDPQADPAKEFGNRARAAGIPVLALQQIRWRPGWLRALPRRERIAILHVHGQRANYFVWLMRRLFPRTWGRVALVATVHGWVQDNLLRRIVTALELRTLRECDTIITVSGLQKQQLIAQGFAAARIRVVRPGIPYLAVAHAPTGTAERQAARARWNIPANAYVIAAVGRLSTEKRHDLYLDVCAALAPQLPQAVFLLVGGGKREAALKAQAAALGLGERLIFTGLTRDMAAVYAATDLLMLTSDTEGTPHVLLEAMGSGIPIVATAVGGIPEFVTDGTHGLLVPAGDRAALVAAARRVHDDPALRAQLVAGGRTVAAQFSMERMVAEIEQVYATVLAQRRNSGAP
ncbi:MAG: glycosyltransferase [Chloroflexota bacterium]|nr:glycosyltransferase [Chloroflexota bacterium]